MYYDMKLLYVFVVAFGAGVFLLPRLASIAEKIGLVDHPNSRKVHRKPTPLIGGLGMAMALSLACLLFVPLANLRGYYAGAIVVVIVGFLDDFKELGHRSRFVAQAVAAALMIFQSDVILRTFGDIFAMGSVDLAHPWVSVPLTMFCAIGVMNAINMMDGLDGLAGGISLIAFASFSMLANVDRHPSFVLLGIALCGVTLAFLIFNWRPAKLFMGDAGSMFLGFSLVFFAVGTTQEPGSHIRPVTALLFLAIPIADTLTVMALRISQGRSPFRADNIHLHHLLLGYVGDRKLVVKLILGMAATFSGLAVVGVRYEVPESLLFVIFLVYLAVQMAFSFRATHGEGFLMDGVVGKRASGGRAVKGEG